MPYYKKRYRKRYRPRYRYKKRSLASKAYALAKKVQKDTLPEKKYHDVDLATSQGTSWGTTNIVQIAQGDTGITRVGDKIRIKSVQIEGRVTMQGTAHNTTLTMALVRWKRPNGQTISTSDVWKTNEVFSLRSAATITDYQVIKKWRFIMSDEGKNRMGFKDFIKLNFLTKYDADTGVIGEQVENGLYIMIISDRASPDWPLIEYNCRVRFTDQ